MKNHLLAIDNGTQSVRAIIFDSEGQMVAGHKVPIEPYFSREPGWAEQEPVYYWQKLCEACQGLWQQGISPASIAAVSVTTQRGTVICLDDKGEPLRPAIVWLDQRELPEAPPLPRRWSLLFNAIGEGEALDLVSRKAQCNWLKYREPGVWSRTRKFVLLSGYFTWKMTGRMRDSVGSQVAYIPFDYKRLTWARPWDWKWHVMQMRRDQLPDLVKPGSVLGHISAEAARETGLPEGLPMIAAAADKACEVLGSGALDPHIACLSFGTTATINTLHRRYVEPSPLMPPYPAPVPDAHCVEVQVQRGFWLVNWFKQEFGFPEQERARELGVAPESLFDELVEQVPAGSMGLMLQPYWSPGIRQPGREAKGAIIGFGDVHTRAHVYRAILEGLTYALREGGERIEKRSGTHMRRLRVSGGGAQSNAAMQITADVFGLPAERPHTFETSALGAAIVASVGMGIHDSFATAVQRMTGVAETFEPDPANRRLYDKLYRRVYQPMYQQLQPLYKEIQAITGYPR